MAIIDKPVRTCATCKKTKLNARFARDRRGALTFECKECKFKRRRPIYARAATRAHERECRELGLAVTATYEEVVAAKSAAFSKALAECDGPWDLTIRLDLKNIDRSTEVGEARYRQLRHEQHATERPDSELRYAFRLTDEDLAALPEGEREDMHQLREYTRQIAAEWKARRAERAAARANPEAHPAKPQTDLGRLCEAITNPTPARVKAREQQKARNARRDPRKVALSNARRNLKKAVENGENQAAKRASLTPHAERGDVGAQNILSSMGRDEYLNQQAQAKWRGVIEALENELAEPSQAP